MKEKMVWIKGILIACFVVFIVLIMVNGEKDSNTDIAQMETDILASSNLDGMEKEDGLMVKKVFGLNEADYEGVLYYKGTGALDVTELLVIRLKSDDQRDTVEAAIDSRLQGQINSFTGYGTNQLELLEASEIKSEGNYCLFVVAEDAAVIKEAFMDAL